MSELAMTRVGAADAAVTVAMLHGMFGRGRNWQVIARDLVRARPDVACLLIDLPFHGESPDLAPSETVQGVSAALAHSLDEGGTTIQAVLGHSFGGKVGLALARQWNDRPLQVWIIDSTPAPGHPEGNAWALLQTVRGLPLEYRSRDALTGALEAKGWSADVARWMATNLRRDGSRFVWRLDFDVMERLILDFYRSDFQSVVEHPDARHVFHFVKATRSNVLTSEVMKNLETVGGDHVKIHVLDGGHWIHAEKPGEVVALLAATL
jgi:esterase